MGNVSRGLGSSRGHCVDCVTVVHMQRTGMLEMKNQIPSILSMARIRTQYTSTKAKRPGEGTHMKGTGMLVVSHRDVN